MTVADAVKVMGVLDSLHDGTPKMAVITSELHGVLLVRPVDEFWEKFWLFLNRDTPQFRAVEQLFARGAVTDRTTFAEFFTGAAN